LNGNGRSERQKTAGLLVNGDISPVRQIFCRVCRQELRKRFKKKLEKKTLEKETVGRSKVKSDVPAVPRATKPHACVTLVAVFVTRLDLAPEIVLVCFGEVRQVLGLKQEQTVDEER
jgi:hypothetical protein